MASSSSIRTTVHESLPYIDKEPTEAEREAAQALITAELSQTPSSPSTNTTAPSLPPLREPNFSPLIVAELERIGTKEPLKAIDLSRYEIQDSDPLPSSQESPSSLISPLQRAYTTLTYLLHRQTNLHLLNSYGKNAWLVSNWQTESLLSALERDLASTKNDIDLINLQRRRLQVDDHQGYSGGVAEELRGLEEAWKKGVGRVLETEIATENLRQKILALERQRAGL